MFDFGFSEVLLIFVIALIVLGPEKLPRLASQVGRWIGRARAMARQFKEQLEEEVNLEDVRKAHDAAHAKEREASKAAGLAAPAVAASAVGAVSTVDATSADGLNGAATGAESVGGASATTPPASTEPAATTASDPNHVPLFGSGGEPFQGPDPSSFRADTFSHAHATNEHGAYPDSSNGAYATPDAQTPSEANVAAAQGEKSAVEARNNVGASGTSPTPASHAEERVPTPSDAHS